MATFRGYCELAGDGIDLFIRTAALRGSLTITLAVAARIGDDDLAAHQIAFEIWNLLALTLVRILALDCLGVQRMCVVRAMILRTIVS